MSRLTVYDEDECAEPRVEAVEAAQIASILDEIGVRFERWPTHALPENAESDEILSAYAFEVDRLKREGGYRSVDVIRMAADHPERAALRGKFLSEHTHAEDEVRFFVAGEGLFTLHARGKVYNLLCTEGDLISVPAGIPHWFDMGPSPSFTAIRLFVNADGWIANFTGDAIADRFPRHEPALA